MTTAVAVVARRCCRDNTATATAIVTATFINSVGDVIISRFSGAIKFFPGQLPHFLLGKRILNLIMSRSDCPTGIDLTNNILTGSFLQEREIVYQDNVTIAISPYLHNIGVYFLISEEKMV